MKRRKIISKDTTKFGLPVGAIFRKSSLNCSPQVAGMPRKWTSSNPSYELKPPIQCGNRSPGGAFALLEISVTEMQSR